MSIIVLLSLIHFFHFFLLLIIIYKYKTTRFSSEMEIIIISLFRKLTKVSTNNLKIDMKETSDSLKMHKKYHFCINPYLLTKKKCYPMFREVHYTGLTITQ